MNKKQKTIVYILIGLIAVVSTAIMVTNYLNTGITLNSSDEAIEYLKDKYSDLDQYPADTLPPRTIETERAKSGWYIAFIQNGSGIPYISAKCYYIKENGRIVSEKSYKREDNDSMSSTFSARECQPTDENINDIPRGCTTWFDGCNTCGVKNGKVDVCTLMYCENPQPAKCISYE